MRKLLILMIIAGSLHSQNVEKFIVVGDTHHTSPSEKFEETLLYEIALAAISEGTEFIFLLGDLVIRDYPDGSNLDSIFSDWKFIQDTLNQHGIRLYACRGNIDMNSAVSWKHIFSGSYAPPGNGPEGEEHYTYSIEGKNFLFLSLDEFTNYNRINYDWVLAQLEESGGKFVFAGGHMPAFKIFQTGLSYQPASRDSFWTAMLQHNGKIFFSGHGHFYDHSIISNGDGDPYNDMHQMVVGTGRSSFHPDGEYNGDNGQWTPERIYHEASTGYLLVEVSETNIVTTWKHRTEAFKFEEGGDTYSFLLTGNDEIKQNDYTFTLHQNYPNPFNSSTVMRYQIPVSVFPLLGGDGGEFVTLKIYDILGRVVAVLVNEMQKPGSYRALWNAEGFSSGIYFYQLKAGENLITKKMLLVK